MKNRTNLKTYKRAFESIEAVCSRAAKGDHEARITNTEEFGELGQCLNAINNMLDQVDAYVRESSASLEYASQRKYYRPFLLRGTRGDFRRGAQVINAAREAMEHRHKLTEEFQSTVTSVVEVVSQAACGLQETAHGMATDAETTHEQSTAVSTASDRAAHNSQAVAAGTEELSASIGDISRQANQSMVAAQVVAEEMERASQAALELNEAAQRIEQVASFVKDIAGQTNLLALNATIEAARAGEVGRGFAVVASEVKALAIQVSDATTDIEKQVESINEAGERTGSAINSIDGRIREVREVTTAIAAAVQQQSAATAEISNNTQQAADGAQEISANVGAISTASEKTGVAAKDVLNASQELAEEADSLKEKVDVFLQKLAAA